MTLVTKLLLYLNSDPAHIENITEYLYKDSDESPERKQAKAVSIIKNARLSGWRIVRDKNQYYLPQEDYDYICQNPEILTSKIDKKAGQYDKVI